jgi:hypothetical protein
MNKKNYLLATLVAWGIMSCSETGGLGNANSVTIGKEPTTITTSTSYPNKINTSEEILTFYMDDCGDSGQVVQGSQSLNYKVQNGKLYLWPEGECNAEVYSGTSSSIQGKWTPTNMDELAPGSTDSSCGLDTNKSNSTSEVITITSTGVSVSTTETDWCWSDDYAYSSHDSTQACDSYQEIRGTDTAVVTLVSKDASTGQETIQFQFNGKTCSYTEPNNEPSARVCSAAWTSFQASAPDVGDDFYWDEWLDDSAKVTFDACVESSGWTGSIGL